jgi:hypothetical protein
MWPYTLSGRLPIVALVGRYPTNKLIGRGPIQKRQVPKDPRLFHNRLAPTVEHAVLPPVSRGYPPLLGRLPTRYSPVRRSCTPEGALPLDLHVLGTPPAFILSQDQTLQLKLRQPSHRSATVDFSESSSSLSFRRPAKTRRRRSVGRSIQFSKSLFPCRVYYSRSAALLCQASNGADEGASPYGTETRLSTPFKENMVPDVEPRNGSSCASSPPSVGTRSSVGSTGFEPDDKNGPGAWGCESWKVREGQEKGGGSQGKEGKSWLELSTGWRAPR